MASGVHTYETRVMWADDGGSPRAEGGQFPVSFDAPPEFGGQAGKWTPELLQVAAVEGCTLMTFLSIARRKQVKVKRYQSSAVGELAKDEAGVHRFVRFEVRPVVEVATEADAEKARAILGTVHKYCFIGSSLKAETNIMGTVSVSG